MAPNLRTFAVGVLTLTHLACSTPEEDPIFVGSPTAGVSAEQLSQWSAAYGWGDHSAAGYLTSEADPLFAAAPAASIAAEDLSRWNAASSWGDHSAAGYLTSESPAASIGADDLTRWNTAHSWGDHSAAGYLTSEVDPLFSGSPAASITGSDLLGWDTAQGWGNHAAAGYLKTETDPKVGALTNGRVPRWSGSQLVSGMLVDTGSLVGVGTGQPETVLDVYAPSSPAAVDQAQEVTNVSSSSAQTQVQTFRAGVTGALTAIAVMSATGTFQFELRTNGLALLASATCNNPTAGWFLCRFPSPAQVTAGQDYRFIVIPPGFSGFWMNNANPYPNGSLLNQGGSYDLAFRTYVSPAAPVSTLQVGTTVNVKTLLRLQPMAQPSAALAGEIYFDSTTKRLRYFDGSAWITL